MDTNSSFMLGSLGAARISKIVGDHGESTLRFKMSAGVRNGRAGSLIAKGSELDPAVMAVCNSSETFTLSLCSR